MAVDLLNEFSAISSCGCDHPDAVAVEGTVERSWPSVEGELVGGESPGLVRRCAQRVRLDAVAVLVVVHGHRCLAGEGQMDVLGRHPSRKQLTGQVLVGAVPQQCGAVERAPVAVERPFVLRPADDRCRGGGLRPEAVVVEPHAVVELVIRPVDVEL
jgi:hypothetical protein